MVSGVVQAPPTVSRPHLQPGVSNQDDTYARGRDGRLQCADEIRTCSDRVDIAKHRVVAEAPLQIVADAARVTGGVRTPVAEKYGVIHPRPPGAARAAVV